MNAYDHDAIVESECKRQIEAYREWERSRHTVRAWVCHLGAVAVNVAGLLACVALLVVALTG